MRSLDILAQHRLTKIEATISDVLIDMAEALTKKKCVRAGHKASATKLLHQINGATTAPSPDTANLRSLRMSLTEKIETLKLLDGEIVDLIDDKGALASEIEQADEFRASLYSAMVKIDGIVSPAPPAPPSASATSTLATSTPPPHVRSSPASSRVKLPKLTIRPFNGELKAWTTFWDSFEAAIHKNGELSDVDKFNYLRSLLEHTAREAISGLSLTSADYGEAISILKKRFGSKQQIVNKHMDVLLNVDPVTSAQNVKGLRHLYDLVESHVRSLNSLGVTSDSYGNLLSPVLLNKLPPELRLIVSHEVSESDWSLDALMKAIVQEIEARERATTHSSQGQQRRAGLRRRQRPLCQELFRLLPLAVIADNLIPPLSV